MVARVGRKLIFCVSGLGQLVLGLVGPFVTNFGLYCASLFLYGVFGSGGASVTGFVLSKLPEPKYLEGAHIFFLAL